MGSEYAEWIEGWGLLAKLIYIVIMIPHPHPVP